MGSISGTQLLDLGAARNFSHRDLAQNSCVFAIWKNTQRLLVRWDLDDLKPQINEGLYMVIHGYTLFLAMDNHDVQ